MLSALRRCRPAVLFSLVFLSGCATPDFHPFATETASLGSAISAEQAEVQAHLAKVAARAEARDPDDPRLAKMKRHETDYANDSTAIDAVMAVAVDYSSTLVALAAKGETGAQSVSALADSLKGLSAAVGVAFPAAASVPAWTVELVQEIGKDVTRIQAQQSLAAALKMADPAVARIARTVGQVYAWPNGPQAEIVRGLHVEEVGILRDEVGKNRLAFYRGVNVANVKLADRSPQTRLEYFFGDIDDRLGRQYPAAGVCGLTRTVAAGAGEPVSFKDDPHCLTGQTAQGLAAITTLLSGIEPQFQGYNREVAASSQWLQQRAAISVPIAAAAAEWAAEHHAIMKKLDECGGLHALRQSCGNLTFANLKLFVGRVKAIAAKGENRAEQ